MSEIIEIIEGKHRINYNPETATVTCEGSLLLNGAPAYEPILHLLKQAAEAHAQKTLNLDIRGIKFLNSSGINMMTKFIMYLNTLDESERPDLLVTAYQHVSWQKRLCVNLGRLMPTMKMKLEEIQR